MRQSQGVSQSTCATEIERQGRFSCEIADSAERAPEARRRAMVRILDLGGQHAGMY